AYSAELAVAIEAARAAAAIQVQHYEQLEHIVKKSAKDVVTEADHLSEETIIATIRRAFPGDEVLAEESGHSGAPASDGPVDGSGANATVEPAHRIWVIDPLDGTVNYAAGIPHFCTSIALVVGGQPTVAVVLDPMRGDLFSAVRGQGAQLDGQPIHASDGELIDGVISMALPPTGFAKREAAVRKAVRVPRSMGSAALGLAWVGNGRFDAFVQWRGLSLWDIAAAGLIAAEGGATVTSNDGGTWFDLTRPTRATGIVAAPAAHHATLLGLLR
ncbi:MAG: inositol monophosphatase, partial [Chloroflexi bacterium]|nr:inositol monophosphatase [Chloroflexota bacterium]